MNHFTPPRRTTLDNNAVPSIDASCYKIEGDRLFYKLPGTEDKWKSVSFEMVSEDIFIFNNSSVFIRKK